MRLSSAGFAVSRVCRLWSIGHGLLAMVAAATVMVLSACEAGPGPVPDMAMVPPDLAVIVIPDLALPPPAFCGPASCLPPACCGGKCMVDGDCCAGTSCQSGRCTPPGCAGCGEVGCAIDFVACTAKCAQPACCLAPCMVDGDCCPGARCGTDVNKQMRCMPKACDVCTGFRALCDVGAGCGITCRPPLTCGKACQMDAECGAGNLCRLFLDGRKLCVPSLFTNTCNACGQGGCLFHPDTCDVECPPAPMPDLAMAPPDLLVVDLRGASDAALSDGGAGDAGAVDAGAVDAGAVDAADPDDLTVPPPPPDLVVVPVPDLAAGDAGNFAPGCKSCCAVCTKDADCCGTMKCRSDGKGRNICTPAECLQCLYGCKFTCP